MLVRELVKMLGSVDHVGATLHEVHELLDFVVCVLERPSSLVLVRIVLNPGEVPVLPVLGECHRGRELLAILEDILRTSDTTGIVSSLIVVGKRSPFGSSVDDTCTNDEPTVGADDVTTGEFLRQVWRVDLAIWAEQDIAQVLLPRLSARGAVCREHFGFVWSRRIDVAHFAEDFEGTFLLLSAPAQLLVLPFDAISTRDAGFNGKCLGRELVLE